MFWLLLLFSKCKLNASDSFSFMSQLKKGVQLIKPEKYLNNNNIYSTSNSNSFKNKKEEDSQKEWYYVHLLTQNISSVFNLIKVERKKEIIKNTFSLFLSTKQLEQISNIALVKKINPEDKYHEENKSFKEISHFVITAVPHFQLPSTEYYKIEKRYNIDSYQIRIDEKDLTKKKKIIDELSLIPEIKSIIAHEKPTIQNSFATGFTQKNNFNFSVQGQNILTIDRYLNNNGLNGEEQIVTVMDTPLDYYHSMFRDDNTQFELNKFMPNHRKIVYYGFDGSLDDLKLRMSDSEHGTHVCGTVAGKNDCPNDKFGLNHYNGQAPEAKILYAGHFNQVDSDFLAELMKKHGSTISSNSWGSTGFDINMHYYYGELAYKNPEAVFIFAACNDYDKLGGNFSVGDPSGSKNVLCVGAISDFYVYKPRRFMMKSLNNPDYSVIFEDASSRNDDLFFAGNASSENFGVIDMSKGNQCKEVYKYKITLLYGEYSNWVTNCLMFSGSHMLYLNDEQKVKEILKMGGPVYFQRIFDIDENKTIERATYSSTGPTNNGLLKPDVMAPGTSIGSAKSKLNSDHSHGCLENLSDDYVMMDGTSMATPNIAGGMALVHQYFSSGRWIEKVDLNGATSRALMINSCTHPFKSKIPDITFGHGVVDLSTILPIEKDFGVRITHQKANQKNTVSNNGHVTATLKVNKALSKNKLQITLSYLDPLLDIESLIPITRDLDMIIVSPSKKVYIGDHLDSKDTQHASTNEKVIIDESDVEEGEYIIHIYGGAFVDGESDTRQEFSVVATGPIENGYLEFDDSNKCPCDKCDPKRPGFCLCDGNQNIGQTCQVKIETIKKINKGSFTVGPLEIKRVRFASKKKVLSLKSQSVKPGRGATIWVSEKCHMSLGEYEINGETGVQSKLEKITNISFNSKEICVAIFNINDRATTYDIEVFQDENDTEDGDDDDDDNTKDKKEKEDKTVRIVLLLVIGVVVAALITLAILITICCIQGGLCGCCIRNNYDRSLLNSDLAASITE